jgi:hypothetical protein
VGSSGRLITSADIADLSIVNADVATAAGIVASKLADLGANNVLRSSGAGNVAGKVLTADILAGAVTFWGRVAGTPSTTSGSLVDASGMSYSLTTTTGDIVLFGISGIFTCTTAGAFVNMNMMVGPTTVISGAAQELNANQQIPFTQFDVGLAGTAFSAGAQTHKLQMATNAGTMTFTGRIFAMVWQR